MASTHLNAPVVGMAPTADNGGYWLVASDGGVFAQLDAQFHGSMGGTHLNAPVVGMAATPTGGGYWLAAADGGVFALGNAPFQRLGRADRPERPGRGHRRHPHRWRLLAGDLCWTGLPLRQRQRVRLAVGSTINGTIVAIDTTSDGGGYWLVGSDGGVYAYGDAPFLGSLPGQKITVANIVGITGHGTLAPVRRARQCPGWPASHRRAASSPGGQRTPSPARDSRGATVAFGAGNPGTTVHVVSASQITEGSGPHRRDGDSDGDDGRRHVERQELRVPPGAHDHLAHTHGRQDRRGDTAHHPRHGLHRRDNHQHGRGPRDHSARRLHNTADREVPPTPRAPSQ